MLSNGKPTTTINNNHNFFYLFQNIIIGITIGMIACFWRVSSRRQEVLLYMAASILAANAVDAVLTEWCFYWVDFSKLLANRPYQILIHHGMY